MGKSKPKATNAKVIARTHDMLRAILDGAESWDILEYVRKQESDPKSCWHPEPGEKPLCRASVYLYAERAEELIDKTCEPDRRQLIKKHEKRRIRLYAQAVARGNLKVAATVMKDLAELQGLYPPKKTELSGQGGGPVILQIVEEIVGGPVALPHIEEEIVHADRTPENALAPGPASLPQE